MKKVAIVGRHILPTFGDVAVFAPNKSYVFLSKATMVSSIPVIELKTSLEKSIGFKDDGPYARLYNTHALLFRDSPGNFTMLGVSNPLMLISLDGENSVIQYSHLDPGLRNAKTHDEAKDVIEMSKDLFDELGIEIGSKIDITEGHLFVK